MILISIFTQYRAQLDRYYEVEPCQLQSGGIGPKLAMREQCLFFAISGPELCLDKKSARCQAGTLQNFALQPQIKNGCQSILVVSRFQYIFFSTVFILGSKCRIQNRKQISCMDIHFKMYKHPGIYSGHFEYEAITQNAKGCQLGIRQIFYLHIILDQKM